jgi:hypothetical protein
MKKLFILFIVLTITFPVFSQLKDSHVVGTWDYTVETGSDVLKGVITLAKNDGKLTGQVATNDGYTLPFSKIEIKPENVLYLELQTDSDVIKITVTVENNKFKGVGSSYQGDAPITGVKRSE